MRRVTFGARLGLGLAIGLLAMACAAPLAPTSPAGMPGTPLPRAGTPGAAMNATATAQVMGLRATPGVAATATPTMMGTPAPTAAHQLMMRDMDQFSDQLRRLAGVTPSPTELLGMFDRASVLMEDIHQNATRMSRQELGQSLAKMSDIMGQMIQVVDTHARQIEAVLQPAPTATPDTTMGGPGGMMGTPGPRPPGAMMGTPPAVSPEAQQLMGRIDQMRDRMMRMVSGMPTHMEIIGLMQEMQRTLATMSQQVGALSEQEISSLTGDMAQAMDDLVTVMEVHVQQEMAIASPTASPTP